MTQYKCVPAPRELAVTSKKDYESAVRSFATLINSELKDGWKFKSMENIAVTQKAGCLMALFGQSNTTVHFNMLIFERELDATIDTNSEILKSGQIGTELTILNSFISSKNSDEIVKLLKQHINSSTEAKAFIDHYLLLFGLDLIEELKNISNSYDKIRECVQIFIDFNLIESSYPHEKKY